MSESPSPLHSQARRENPLHQIHRWSIEHPYAIIAFYAAMLWLAFLAVRDVIPRRFAPYVQSPLVGVVTMMPGLSAQEMETYISKPIEEQLVNVPGLRTIRSTSQEGFSIVTLEFPYGANMQRAMVDVQAQMNLAQSNLPTTGANLKPSFVVPIDPLNLPILSLSLRGDPGEGWDPVRVREFADNTVISRLKTVPDVQAVVPFGGYRRQMQVIVDREKLAAYGLSILDVRNAIDRFNVSRSGGTITSGPDEAIVRIDTRALRAEDVLAYPVTARPSPRVVYVRDVARVLDTHWERRSAYHYLKREKGAEAEVHPSIQVSVIQNPGASSARVAPAVMNLVGQMERENPGLTFEVAYDNAHFVNILFENVWHELGLAILLTAIAVLFFLGEWRGTLIALVTLPTSLALAILMMVPFGMTFNSGTLIGLLLSIGRLVDDSIIDIHAVERHLRMGKDPKTATIDGIAEVRLAVIASTLMIVLALTPLLFAGGIVQLMFVELVWPLIFGLLASMLVSFTLTALLCARWLRHEEARTADRRHPLLRWLYVPLDPFQRGLDRMEAGYAHLIDWMLRHRFANFARVLATVIAGFTFYYFIGSEMMPLADTGQAVGFLEMQPGTSFARTEQAVGQLEKILAKHPELEKASIEIGAESMFESWTPFYTGYQMPQVNGAALMLTFSDKDKRRRSIFTVMDAVHREALATIPGIRRLQIKEMGSDVMATAAAPIHVNIYGPDLGELDRLAREVNAVAGKMPEMFQPATTWALGLPDYRVRVNPQRAQEVGLSPEEIAQQSYYALRGGLTGEFYRLPNLRQNTILVRYEQDDRRTARDVENLYLTTPEGRQIPLKSVADVERNVAPSAIEHDGLRRVVGVTGYYRAHGAPGTLPSMDVVMNLVANAYGGNKALGIEPINFPPGYGLEMRGDMTQMMDSFRRLLGGLLLALAFMYLVLVIQFRGFLQPLQMIASLPLELAGVFLALWIAHQSFSTVSILGIIVLTGMDITTAVLLIDLVMKYRDQGIERDEAIRRACPQRLRPILMTAGITLIVMLPVAVAPKTGLDAYQPLAVAVVGGLLVGTILSLFDIPLLHTYVDDFTRWLNRTFLNRDWRWPITVLLLLAAPAAFAQPDSILAGRPTVNQTLSLDEAVDIALRESPVLRGAAEEVAAAAAQLRAARAETRPWLSANAFASGGSNPSIVATPMTTQPAMIMGLPRGGFLDANLMAMFPLATGGRLAAMIRQAAARRNASEADLAARRQEIALMARMAYREVIARRALIDVARVRVEENEERLRLDRARLEQERVPPITVQRDEAEVAAARQEQTAVERDAGLALLTLRTVMGVHPDSRLDVSGPPAPEPLADILARLTGTKSEDAAPAALLRLAERRRPELGAATERVRAANAEVGVARSAFQPQINLFAAGDALKMRDEPAFAGVTYGIVASLPLANGGQRQARRDAAEAERRRAEREREQVALEIARDIDAALLRLRAAEQNIAAAEAALAAAREEHRVARVRYDVGRSLQVEVLDALATRVRAEANVVQARFEHGVAADQLERAVGVLRAEVSAPAPPGEKVNTGR